MAFIAKGEEYQLFVNGVEVHLEIDDVDRATIEEYVGRFRYVDSGKWHGYYRPFGSADITIRERDFNGVPVYRTGPPPIGACVP